MSRLTKSKHPAYHLRPNKAVDRFLFLEIIRALGLYRSLKRHTYVSLAGPFLEDVRVLAHEFPTLQFVSVESDEETYKRQKFHRCSRNVKLHHKTFGDFLAANFPTGRTITWADYTSMTRRCLLETSGIARMALPLSLLRITVKAETPIYRELGLPAGRDSLPQSKERQFEGFVQRFQKEHTLADVAYDDAIFKWDGFRQDNYPTLLMRMLRDVVAGACSFPKQFMPLHASKYSDGTVMLSFTGLFCDAREQDKVRRHFEVNGILKAGESVAVKGIDVPVLTTKERLKLEKLLPSADQSGQSCAKALGYLIEGEGTEELSGFKMQQYEQYHRFYPYFGKLLP